MPTSTWPDWETTKFSFAFWTWTLSLGIQLQKGSPPCRVVNSPFKAKFSLRSPSWYLKLPIINLYRCLQEMGDRLWKYRFTHDCLSVDRSFKRPVKSLYALTNLLWTLPVKVATVEALLATIHPAKTSTWIVKPRLKNLVRDGFRLHGPPCLRWNTLKVFSSGFKFTKETT